MINSQVEVMSNGRFIHGKRFMYERGVWTAINRPDTKKYILREEIRCQPLAS